MSDLSLIDDFIADKRAENRMAPRSEDSYRHVLRAFLEHAGSFGAADRQDVKRFLARYENATTRKQRHAVLRSFFDWMVYEEILDVSPASQVRPVRIKSQAKTRLTREEIVKLLNAAEPVRRDRWAVWLMLYAGLRNEELRTLKGRDLAREGWVHVIGKGGKERWMPVVPELADVVGEIRLQVAPEAYVLPGRRSLNPPQHTRQREVPEAMLSSSALRKQIVRIGERAGIALHVHPHLLRHAYGDAVAKYAGLRVAQALLGHESVETTAGTYTGSASLDELAVSMTGFGYRGRAVYHAEGPSAAQEGAQEAHD